MDYLELFKNKGCFSIIALKRGYYQIGLEEKSVPYTSFVTPHRVFDKDRYEVVDIED